jgi:hypothetical protein
MFALSSTGAPEHYPSVCQSSYPPDAGDVSSHHGQRSIQDMHTASPSPALTGLLVRAPREPAPGQAVSAGSDRACVSVDSRDKIGVLHTTAFARALALRIGK